MIATTKQQQHVRLSPNLCRMQAKISLHAQGRRRRLWTTGTTCPPLRSGPTARSSMTSMTPSRSTARIALSQSWGRYPMLPASRLLNGRMRQGWLATAGLCSNGKVQLMETDSSNMTVPGPQKLLDWVGHMTNILQVARERADFTSESNTFFPLPTRDNVRHLSLSIP